MTAPLKPCPFCGGEAELVRPALGGRPYVCCVENFCAGPKSTTEAAVTAWNIRADAPELLALMGALRQCRTIADHVLHGIHGFSVEDVHDTATAALQSYEALK